jgi:hypothetical protein
MAIPRERNSSISSETGRNLLFLEQPLTDSIITTPWQYSSFPDFIAHERFLLHYTPTSIVLAGLPCCLRSPPVSRFRATSTHSCPTYSYFVCLHLFASAPALHCSGLPRYWVRRDTAPQTVHVAIPEGGLRSLGPPGDSAGASDRPDTG